MLVPLTACHGAVARKIGPKKNPNLEVIEEELGDETDTKVEQRYSDLNEPKKTDKKLGSEANLTENLEIPIENSTLTMADIQHGSMRSTSDAVGGS